MEFFERRCLSMNGAERDAANRRSEREVITTRQNYVTELNRVFPGERKRPLGQRNPEFLELRRQIIAGNYEAFIERTIPEGQPSDTNRFSAEATQTR